MSARDLIETERNVLSPSLFLPLEEREGRISVDTLINGLGHAIPRDPFEKLRTIDLDRFRNEGCTLTASLSPCTERKQRERHIGMSSHSVREGAAGAESEIDRGNVAGAVGESGSVHRWLRLPRWMYKGGLGSREPEPERARTHVDIRYHAWRRSRQDSGSFFGDCVRSDGKNRRPRCSQIPAALSIAAIRTSRRGRGGPRR